MKRAACVLIINPEIGKVLGVSRRGQPDQWGMPGGKIDEGELAIDAALRELREETGVILEQCWLHLMYEAVDECGYLTTTYFYRAMTPMHVTPIQMEAYLNVGWVDFEQFQNGPFRQYYEGLLKAILRNLVQESSAAAICKDYTMTILRTDQ